MAAGTPARALICDFGGVLTRNGAPDPAAARTPEERARWLAAVEIHEPMFELVVHARATGRRTALLTNNALGYEPDWRTRVPRLDDAFDVVIDACEHGVRKPESAAYELVLRVLGDVPPGECVFVDDVPANCEAAAALGMRAVLFSDDGDAIRSIEDALGLGSPR